MLQTKQFPTASLGMTVVSANKMFTTSSVGIYLNTGKLVSMRLKELRLCFKKCSQDYSTCRSFCFSSSERVCMLYNVRMNEIQSLHDIIDSSKRDYTNIPEIKYKMTNTFVCYDLLPILNSFGPSTTSLPTPPSKSIIIIKKDI